MVWEKICEGHRLRWRRDGTIFGHPDCNSWASIWFRAHGQIHARCCRRTNTKRMLGQVLARIGGLSLVTDDAADDSLALLGVLAHNPGLALRSLLIWPWLVGSGRMPVRDV